MDIEIRRPEPARIVAMSGALSLHVLGVAVLLIPITMPAAPEHPPRVIDDRPLEVSFVREPEPPPPLTTPPVRVRRPPPVAVPRTETPVLVTPVAITPVSTSIPVPVESPPETGSTPVESGEGSGPAQAVETLAYVDAPPPRYPIRELRRGREGIVLLRVLVGIDGQPEEVTVHRSSGHRALDEEARRHVGKRWRFRPAMRDGQPTRAVGILPIEFSVARG